MPTLPEPGSFPLGEAGPRGTAGENRGRTQVRGGWTGNAGVMYKKCQPGKIGQEVLMAVTRQTLNLSKEPADSKASKGRVLFLQKLPIGMRISKQRDLRTTGLRELTIYIHRNEKINYRHIITVISVYSG